MTEPSRPLPAPRPGRARARPARRDQWSARLLSVASVLFALLAAGSPAAAHAQRSVPPDPRYADAISRLDSLVRHEMADKRLPSVTVALVDDQRTVWARAYGFADVTDSTVATAETVLRVGSVSKLFTDIAIMQRVERGEVDLDAPIVRYLPTFRPADGYGVPITLRQLMAHRSGLMREPPVGNYFDPAGSTLSAMVESLNGRPLVYEPGTRTKYSNAGTGVVGRVLEVVTGQPFAQAVRSAVLEPMGMSASAFEPVPDLVRRLSKAKMWTLDGREFEAPTFELGMAPAGSMYSTVLDLGRFLSVLFAEGRGPAGPVIEAATLEQMWTPQFASPGQRTGFGLGFAIGELEGHRRIGHGGAIYGFATDLAALPDEKLGAVAIITLDVSNSVAQRITDEALRLMLAAKHGTAPPVVTLPGPVGQDRARLLAGRYARLDDLAAERADAARRDGLRGDEGARYIDLVERSGELFLDERVRYALRAIADTLVLDDRLAFGTHVLPIADGVVILGRDTLVRVPVAKPAPAPTRFAGLVGEYGLDHDILYILERDGRLHALIEWFFEYPLDELGGDVFGFPASGLYDGERLVFTRGPDGRATQVEAGGVIFMRREVGTEAGVTFRITPQQPVDVLRRTALAAQPPREPGDFLEPDLVELRDLDPTIRYDIRYASTNNFMGEVFYTEPHAFLQRPAAEALVRAHRALGEQGFGLLIHDAYRPWFVTRMFWDATPEDMKQFVANPANGSRHNRGAAVDLTLYDLATGEPVEAVSGYDEFSDRAYPEYPGGTALQRWYRELLRNAMEAEGFRVYEWEWWHFDYADWRRWAIGNVTFDQVGSRR